MLQAFFFNSKFNTNAAQHSQDFSELTAVVTTVVNHIGATITMLDGRNRF